ncbi:DNA topoisomerase IB [Nocardia sp. AG03]|uniref:DNA topoisomerase IB n=1 Tax=Nocardia sp. AG03 TaxID=3025312 RepID=UPI0024185317|nr:DNA topoisomerase IB [Nocardia sp. AG03]
MRLRHSAPDGPGIHRRIRGRGFSYTDDAGVRISDDDVLARITALAIPPAWREVWICPHANGHLQAVGTDAAGRRQYLYHDQWRRDRDEEKFDRVLRFATRLPRLREQVDADLGRSGLVRHRVEAVSIGLIDQGVFRVGGEEYAEENGTRGIATLLRDQVRVHGDDMVFDYVAKGSARRQVEIHDPALARAVRSLRRVRADSSRLLVYREDGGYRELHADDINARFRDLAGMECSAKDLRTWQATVHAAEALARVDRPTGDRARRRVEREVIAEVAETLGNTSAVARDSYIDPRVLRAFDADSTIAAALTRAERRRSRDERRRIVDRAVIRLVRRAPG